MLNGFFYGYLHYFGIQSEESYGTKNHFTDMELKLEST